MHEQQKQLSLLEEEQLKSTLHGASVSLDNSQVQEGDVQAISAANDENMTSKSVKSAISKSQSLDRAEDNHEEGESLLKRSKTLPGRLKTVPTERREDNTGVSVVSEQMQW